MPPRLATSHVLNTPLHLAMLLHHPFGGGGGGPRVRVVPGINLAQIPPAASTH